MARAGFTLPITFGTKTVKGPLSDLDSDFNPLKGAILDSGNGWMNYSTIGGTVNAITLTNTPPAMSLAMGSTFRFFTLNPNTGPSTVNVDTLGSVTIVDWLGNPLVGGEIYGLNDITYDGTRFVLAVRRNQNYTGSDSTNTGNYVVTAAPAGFSPTNGTLLFCNFGYTNAIANPTLNVNGTGALPILNKGGQPLLYGLEIPVGYNMLLFAGTSWLMVSRCYRVYQANSPANPTVECGGFDGVRFYASFTGTTAGISLAHVAEGVPIWFDIYNAMGTPLPYFINISNSAGSALPVYGIFNNSVAGAAAVRIDSGGSGQNLNSGCNLLLSGNVFNGQGMLK